MTKQERAKLRAALKALVIEMLDAENRTTTVAVFEEAMERFPELIQDAGSQLARTACINIIRSLLKEAMKQDDEEISVGLFGESLQNLTVPKCIAMASPTGAREMIWVPTLKATLSELEAYVVFLEAGAAADLAKAQRVKAFHDEVLGLSDNCDVDTPIENLIRENQAQAV